MCLDKKRAPSDTAKPPVIYHSEHQAYKPSGLVYKEGVGGRAQARIISQFERWSWFIYLKFGAYRDRAIWREGE
jgi:hypothetical protein